MQDLRMFSVNLRDFVSETRRQQCESKLKNTCKMKEVVERFRKRLIDQQLCASELGFLSKSAPEIICSQLQTFFPRMYAEKFKQTYHSEME